jgi:Flp pilus assembly protein TadD
MSQGARALDPLSPRINSNVGTILYRAHQNEDALRESKKSIELFPDHRSTYETIARIYARLGQFDDAINTEMNTYKLFGGTPELSPKLAYYYALKGNQVEAKKILNLLIEHSNDEFIPSQEIARVFIGLGDPDQAFIWLEKAFSENERLVDIMTEPIFDPLRSDSRFSELLKKIGFEDYLKN